MFAMSGIRKILSFELVAKLCSIRTLINEKMPVRTVIFLLHCNV